MNQEFIKGFSELKFFENLPLIPPEKMFNQLHDLGYRGQEYARKSLSLCAYRHVKRIKNIYLAGIPRSNLPPKSNYLLMGPTGCGKTYLVELLFKKILKLPTVIVDVTGFSETGYIGKDPITILTQLLEAARGSLIKASCGIVVLDEFDKLASSSNQTRFDGQGSTKDVSGFGVQKELLRMMEESIIDIPTDFNNSLYSTRETLMTDDIMFIACGAFSGFKGLAHLRQVSDNIGFTAKESKFKEQIAVTFKESELMDIENFQMYGFLPELIGRFTRIIPLFPLDEKTLKEILTENVINKYKKEFQSEGIELIVEEKVLDRIVNLSFKRQTGARGLNSILTQYIEEVAYHCFGKNINCEVIIDIDGDEIIHKIVKKGFSKKQKKFFSKINKA